MAQTKQELFKTMASLALTYFTIQENTKAEKQLEDLILINPNHELDPEFYPPKFLEIFHTVQRNFLGRLTVTSTPPGAKVTLGSSVLGTTPLTAEKVLKGKHELKAELAGYAPASREIIIQTGGENREDLQLEMSKQIIEKKAVPEPAKTKKKKKFSPWILIGGAAVAVVAVLLLAGKKSEPEKELHFMDFVQGEPVPIDSWTPTWVPLDVRGIPAKIERIDFRAVISHPGHMEDLVVNIVGTDQQTFFNIWNRGQSSEDPQIMKGSTEVFNALAPNGIWRLMVQNPGQSSNGRIMEFYLKIYFFN